MDNEIRLTGGRITQAVMRRGDFVHRSVCANSPFVHEVLRFLEGRNANRAPRFHGIDERGREILDYIDGTVPDNLGRFSAEQCRQAARIIKTLHDHLKYFPGCPDGWTVCHNDLSPCNFVFAGGEPIAVIDWDAAAFERANLNAYTLERATQVRHFGRDRRMDETVLPYFAYPENWPNRFLGERRSLDLAQFAPVASEYYQRLGWDPATGRPTRATMDATGVPGAYEAMAAGADAAPATELPDESPITHMTESTPETEREPA